MALLAFALLLAQPDAPPDDPVPATLDEFRAAAARILAETQMPGAGIALVRRDGVEWAGGIGFADRDKRTPVTADTHFRVGSISKTFVAIALVQLAEDDALDLDAPLDEVAPEVQIANPWHDTDPVRVIHVLQHTAGFDDMHFTDRYNTTHPPDLPMKEVIAINPRPRRVRWRPATRYSYSNAGYGVAGYLLEKLAGEPFEDYIKREILDPLGMHTSSFRLTAADDHVLARGYMAADGPPVEIVRIHYRPAGNLHSSPREMARFVQMFLNWGELGDAFVIDPEYLATMEQPRTTLAASAGLRTGYGAGVSSIPGAPYPFLGHDGGIDGFRSIYGYSPARDVGFVILLNSLHSNDAMRRLTNLAIRFLKRDVDPPAKPTAQVDAEILRQYTGYYHDANPRNQIFWFVQRLTSGRTIELTDGELLARPLFGEPVKYIPVTDNMFRLEAEVEASRVFTRDADGTMILTGMQLYAERVPRWRIDLLRAAVFGAVFLLVSPLMVAVVWVGHALRARPRFFWELKLAVFVTTIALVAPFGALALTPPSHWGTRNAGTIVVSLATLALPTLTVIIAAVAVAAIREGCSRLLVAYALFVAVAAAGLSGYLGVHGLIGVRLWRY